MPVGTVVLTPGAAYDLDAPSVLDLSAEIPDDWTARTAIAIGAAAPVAPVLLVLHGAHCAHAPQLGFAQRAARRAVAGYVLVDPVLPAPGADWPDAPVVVVVSEAADADTRTAALGARLRGWEIREGDPARIIADLAREP